MIRLRPHHGMCLAYFEGKGYSDGFTGNMQHMLELLEKGAEIANQIYERHTVLAKMLEGLGVPAEIALEDACKMEHDISQESFEKIKAHYNNFIKRDEAAAE